MTDVPDWTTQVVSAPTPLGTLTIPSGMSGSNSLTISVQNHWTGLVLYTAGPIVNYPVSATAALNIGIDLYDNAGNLLAALAVLAVPVVPVPPQIMLPIAGNIDGAVDSAVISAFLQPYPGPGALPHVTAATVVGHVGAMLGTGIQWVATPSAQALLVNPEAAAAGIEQQNTADAGPGSNILKGHVTAPGTIISIPPGRVWKGTVWIAAEQPTTNLCSVAITDTNAGARDADLILKSAASASIAVPDVYVWGGLSGNTLVASCPAAQPDAWAAGATGQLVF